VTARRAVRNRGGPPYHGVPSRQRVPGPGHPADRGEVRGHLARRYARRGRWQPDLVPPPQRHLTLFRYDPRLAGTTLIAPFTANTKLAEARHRWPGIRGTVGTFRDVAAFAETLVN